MEKNLKVIQQAERRCIEELKSINAVNSLSLDIQTALMCVADYKGYRMIAYPNMPLDERVSIVRDYVIR